MASMSPQQRKEMEAMMTKQGVSMSSTLGAVSSNICLRKDMAERSQMPVQTQGDCTSTTSDKTSKA